MTRVGIIGAGDLGVQLAHHAAAIPDLDVVAYFDDTKAADTLVAGIRVIGGISRVSEAHARGDIDAVLVAIGYNHLELRSRLFRELSPTVPFATLVHPSAWVDPSASIGPGSVVYPGCTIDLGVAIGANSLLNVGCVIAHDSSIGDGCFISPAVSIAGFSTIGDGVTLGIGTIVIDNVHIAAGVRTGAGAVVVSDLVEPGLYLGVPARPSKGASAS